MKLLKADERVLAKQAACIFLQELDDSSVQLVAWPFVRIGDYLTFQTYFVEQVKKAFHQTGSVIPFPQQDVHLFSHN